MTRFAGIAAAIAAGVLVCCAPAGAAIIQQGTYRLHNHPDGSARPPLYGLRLDELYDVTANHDVFTFNFDAPGSAMYMDFTGSAIHIYGVSWGGRDVGNDYANDAYRGFYTIDFLYDRVVGIVPGDDDLFVEPPYHQYNLGSIITPLNDAIQLRDGHYSGDQLNFRFGDTDNDLGHRGFAGLSGWGWMFHGPYGSPYHENSDWLFTAELVPAPGAAALVLVAAGIMARRRRD